jgi:hypothetical protein
LAAFKKFVRVQLTQRAKNLSEAFVSEHAAAAVEGVYPTRYPLPALDTLPRTVSLRAWVAALRLRRFPSIFAPSPVSEGY